MRRHRLVLVAAVAVLLLPGATACSSQTGDSVTRSTEGQSVGDPTVEKALTWVPVTDREAAPVAAGPGLNGGEVSTADYLDKVVVINVWGSWCGPCRLEARDLAEASRERASKAAFVGINVRDNNPEAARAFVRAFDVPYPHIYDPAGDQLIRFAGTLPPNGIPATLIVDREGRIAGRVIGVVEKATLLGLIDDAYSGR